MTKGRSARAVRPRRPAKQSSALGRLEPGEALSLLRRLLAAHPDLLPEAEEMARALLGETNFEAIADEVEHGLRALSLHDLGERAGRHRGEYTPPKQAARELLQEVVDPFLAKMKRQMELGLDAQALETCKGILLGLYRIRGLKGDEFLGWAPDFPEEAAAHVVRVLSGRDAPNETRAAPTPRLDEAFLHTQVPKWRDLIARALDSP